MRSRTASAPMPASKRRGPPRTPLPYLRSSSRKFQPSSEFSGRRSPAWRRVISSLALRISSWSPSASPRRRSLLGLERRRCSRGACPRCAGGSSPPAGASLSWISVLTRSISSAAASLSVRGGVLAAVLAGGHDDLAGRLEDDGRLGRAAAEGLERRPRCSAGPRRAPRCGARAPPRAPALNVASSAFSSSEQAVRAPSGAGPRARRGSGRARRRDPAASSSSCWSRRARASSSTHVTMYFAK